MTKKLACLLTFWAALIFTPRISLATGCAEQLVDVVIMLDRSSSIDRAVELPAEAAAAKTLLDTFITLGSGHKVAVAAFSETATILAGGNLSTDYANLKNVIDTQLFINTSGTNIEDAIQKSEIELNTGVNPLKFIVLISDGAPSRRNTQALSNAAAALQAATTAKNNGIRIITIAYDSADGSQTAINGRTLLASIASSGSIDNTVGAVSDAERDQENTDGDDFYVAPSINDLNGIFSSISDVISCNDNDLCTSDVCDENTAQCSYTVLDFDSDNTPDCQDNCSGDSLKTEPGQCGCGAPDTDSDNDGVADCRDQCANAPDVDSDFDGTLDCADLCPNDPSKTIPSICGCNIADDDTDADGFANCNDQCPADSLKTVAGQCGCGIADDDFDGDGVADCVDACQNDSGKTDPGLCGCGVQDNDRDADGTADCDDLCLNDPSKIAEGDCGCGVADTDTDNDGTADCLEVEPVPADPLPTDPLDPSDSLPGDEQPSAQANLNCDFSIDTDGDGLPDCQELAFGTDPNTDDVQFQGSATRASFSSCSLNPVQGVQFNATPLASLLLACIFLMMAKAKKAVGFFFTVLLFAATQAHALDVQNFSPADVVGSGFGVATTQTLKKRQIGAGAYLNFASNPFELGTIGNNQRIAGVVDDFVTTDFVFSAGLSDKAGFTVSFPANFFHNIAPTLVPDRNKDGGEIGDLRVSGKFGVVDAEVSERHFGLALIPFFTLPTGDEEVFFGEKNVTGGLLVAGEKKFGQQRLYSNVGARFREKESVGNLDVGHELLYGFGYQHLFSAQKSISGIAELQGSTVFADFFHVENNSPLEARALVQKDWHEAKNLHTYAGAGMGLTNGYGTPDYRLYVGVSGNAQLIKTARAQVVKAAPVNEVFVETVYFALNKDVYYEVHRVNVESAAAFWKKYPNRVISVVGFTDALADNAYNEKLSLRRAQRVKDALVALGVPTEKISMAYQGEEHPVGDNETEAGRQKNRRVEIQIR